MIFNKGKSRLHAIARLLALKKKMPQSSTRKHTEWKDEEGLPEVTYVRGTTLLGSFWCNIEASLQRRGLECAGGEAGRSLDCVEH